MDNAPEKPKGRRLAARLVDLLHSPVKLRVLLTAAMLGGWYAWFVSPMTAEIDDVTRRTAREAKRVEVAKEVERLRAQVARFEGRLPRKTDPNEWVQYMLAKLRESPLKLVMLDTDAPKDVGPYKAIVVKMEVEGGFHDIDAFLRWLESNPRLLRVDSVQLDPVRNARGVMVAKLVVLGVMG